jgi:hypothetical protein
MEAKDYPEVFYIGETPEKTIDIKTNTAIKNIMNIIESAIGSKVDDKQMYVVRKVVLDEVNGFSKMAKELISVDTNKNKK